MCLIGYDKVFLSWFSWFTLCLCSYFVLAIPISAVLSFVFKLSVWGIWTGLNLGVYALSLSVLVYNLNIDWTDEAKRAKANAAAVIASASADDLRLLNDVN